MAQNLDSNRRPVTVRAARWSAHHPWRAIALWLVFVASCVAVGSAIGLRGMSELDGVVGQSGQASRWLHDADLTSRDTEDVLISARAGTLDAARARAATEAITAAMRALRQVEAVSRATASTRGSARMIEVTLHTRGTSRAGNDGVVAPLLAATARVQRAFPDLRIEQVGSQSLNKAVNDQVASDLSSAASFSLPVTLAIMLIAFGAIVAAGVPILLALSAVGAATGLSSLVSHVIPDSGTTSSMILLMGMAVGVDYSLFFVKRARAERRRGRDALSAIDIAAETAGHSVVVSGIAVIIAMLGLIIADDPTFRSLAAGSIVVVAVAVLGSLTVLPALLVVLGKRLERPRVPVLWRATMQDREPRLWAALLRPSLQRPARTLALAVIALGLLAVPMLSLRLHSDSPAALPSSIAEKQTLDRLVAYFPSQASTQRIVVKAPVAQAAAVAGALDHLAATLDPALFSGHAAVESSHDGTVHALAVDAPFDAESSQARHGVNELRSASVPRAVAGISGARWAVGGDTARSMDYDAHAAQHLPWVIAFVVVLTAAVMGWVFRSVLIALLTTLVNLLSAAAAFGVLALVFQHSWAEGLLGFHSTGAVVNWIPLFTFAVLSGLSMDYHVFVLSAVREAAAEGRSMRDAVRTGILRSAGTVTSAALVMVSVFAIFASLHMVEMKELGLSLAVAVLLDAVVVRGILLPSALTLIGHRLWWPGRVPGERPIAERPRELAML